MERRRWILDRSTPKSNRFDSEGTQGQLQDAIRRDLELDIRIEGTLSKIHPPWVVPAGHANPGQTDPAMLLDEPQHHAIAILGRLEGGDLDRSRTVHLHSDRLNHLFTSGRGFSRLQPSDHQWFRERLRLRVHPRLAGRSTIPIVRHQRIPKSMFTTVAFGIGEVRCPKQTESQDTVADVPPDDAVVENGQDLCSGSCSIDVTITDTREGKVIDTTNGVVAE